MKPAIPWSVKGVEPDAREAAKRAARSAGMTLGAWLNQKLLESEDTSPGAQTAAAMPFARHGAPGPDFGAEPYAASPRQDTYAYRQEGATRELGGVTESLDALRRHLQSADDRAERTFGQVSRSLEVVLTKLDEAGERRRARAGDEGSTSLRAITSALGDVTQRLSAVETRPQSPDNLRGLERSLLDIGRNFETATAQTGRRIDQLENTLDKIDHRMETREGRRMEAVRGLEQAVTELAHQLEGTKRGQTDAARVAERGISDLQSEVAARETSIVSAFDTLRERISELTEEIETTRKALDQTVSENDLTKLERQIAEALDNTATAEDLALAEIRVTTTARAAVDEVSKAVHRDLREELVERIDAAETRSADALGRFETDREERLLHNEQNTTDLSAFENRIGEKFDEITARLETLSGENDARFEHMARDAHIELEALRLEFAQNTAPEPTVTRREAAPEQSPPANLPPLQTPDTIPQMRQSRSPSRARERPQPVPKTPPGANARKPQSLKVERPGAGLRTRTGVRNWVVLLFLALISIGISGLAYTAWWYWDQLQTDQSGQATAPATFEPASGEPTNTAPGDGDGRVALPGRQSYPARDQSAGNRSSGSRETARPAESEPQTTQPSPTSQPVVTAPDPATPSAVQLYTEAVGLLDAQSNGSDRLAAERLREAAEMGLTIAQFRLASLYEEGRGVTQDIGQARDWYIQAATGGNVRAMHNLAIIYAEGSANIEQDYAEAARWFAEAAVYGVRDSQFNLAVLFASGRGVRQDYSQAYLWYSIAETGGDTEAGSQRNALASRIADDIRPRIDAAVANWEPRPVDPQANGRISFTRPLGASRQEIARAQELLVYFGYTPGSPDGLMGPRTAEAIREFERRAGLSVTGRVTPELLSRLEAEFAVRRNGG